MSDDFKKSDVEPRPFSVKVGQNVPKVKKPKMPKYTESVKVVSSEIMKSNYGPKGAGLYDPTKNIERKANNTGDVAGNGPNHNVKAYSSKAGQLSAKQQAAAMHTKSQQKKLSGKGKLLSREEIENIRSTITPINEIKKDEMLEVAPDGKQEIVEGNEPLKKDPKSRWNMLKKALSHDKAFMSMEDELADEEPAQPPQGEEQQQPSEGEEQAQPEGAEEQPQEGEEQPQDDQGQLEAVSDGGEEAPEGGAEQEPQPEGEEQPEEASPEEEPQPEGEEQPQPEEGEENPEEGNGDVSPDQQELIDALKEEGHSDQEIAYIVHGHHAPEVDPSKQAKAQATQAMSGVEMDSATQMAEIERQHALASMEHERSHKQRMSDLEYGDAEKQKGATDMEQSHKQRMLDLEYEKAKRDSSVNESEGEGETKKQLQQLEVEKKKLELKLREQEMKLELEFKQKEHELKLKMMEQQFKEQAKQKSEVSGIKHQQKLVEAKKPPAKKPLRKSEEDDE